MEELREGLLVGIGNPLLDISAVVDENLLTKYNMKPDDAIMAEEGHMPLYKELVDNYKAEYIAGGSVQNTLRVAQWFFKKPYVTTYFGCVGSDRNAEILKQKASEEGVSVQYQVTDSRETGTCAVLITGTHRSLCANLAAANHFTEDHLLTPQSNVLINKGQYFYVSGFFIVVSLPSVIRLADHALKHNNLFAMNLSAPFVSQFHNESLFQVLPYVDLLFGNSMEMEAFAEQNNLGTKDMKEIALKICALPKNNTKRPRVVVITQGCGPVLLVEGECIKEVPVTPLPKEKIVDTNGAGDAFTGGFLAQLILRRNLEDCVRCGIYAASEIIQRSGCIYSGESQFV